MSIYYYTGSLSSLSPEIFSGKRTEINLNITALPFISGGYTASYADAPRGESVYSIGVTGTVGISAFELLLPVTIGINTGKTQLY